MSLSSSYLIFISSDCSRKLFAASAFEIRVWVEALPCLGRLTSSDVIFVRLHKIKYLDGTDRSMRIIRF